jgi:hypothetical protein
MVTEDVVKSQFVYELQGSVYLNSDVKSILDDVKIEQVGKNRSVMSRTFLSQLLTKSCALRVRLSGICGAPPPPTTKLAIFLPRQLPERASP